jgi:hypothetical protein
VRITVIGTGSLGMGLDIAKIAAQATGTEQRLTSARRRSRVTARPDPFSHPRLHHRVDEGVRALARPRR